MASRNEVEEFVRATFRSVWALELLCLLRKNRESTLGHREMVDALRASDFVVTQSIDNLSAMGLVIREADGSARYSPAHPDSDRLAGEAEELYSKSPNAVRRIIASTASPSLTAFADAFRLRKDEK